MSFTSRARASSFVSVVLAAGCAASPDAASKTVDVQGGVLHTGFRQVALVSSIAGAARVQDATLTNAWGLAPIDGNFWIADNASGKLSVYDGVANRATISGQLDLGPGISGMVQNTNKDPKSFMIHGSNNCLSATLLVATENGQLIGVNPDIDARAGVVVVDHGDLNAVYKALAVVDQSTGPMLLAADFRNARIDAFDANFQPVTLASDAFAANVPAGMAPYNITVIGDRIFVAYAVQDDAKHDDVEGAGNGLIAEFDLSFGLVGRLAALELDAPWGVAMAPAEFDTRFGGTLLVGNFGDGHITALDPADLHVIGQLTDASGRPTTIDGLWGMTFGGTQNLFFTAGPNKEADGLFGYVEAVGHINPPRPPSVQPVGTTGQIQ